MRAVFRAKRVLPWWSGDSLKGVVEVSIEEFVMTSRHLERKGLSPDLEERHVEDYIHQGESVLDT